MQVEVTDIPAAFARGTVEAMITMPSSGVSTQAWHYVSHFHHTQAWLSKNMVVVNQVALSVLAPALRQAVPAVAHRAEERSWAVSRQETDAQLAELEAHGLIIVRTQDGLMDNFRLIDHIMTEEWAARAGEDGQVILKAYRQ